MYTDFLLFLTFFSRKAAVTFNYLLYYRPSAERANMCVSASLNLRRKYGGNSENSRAAVL